MHRKGAVSMSVLQRYWLQLLQRPVHRYQVRIHYKYYAAVWNLRYTIIGSSTRWRLRHSFLAGILQAVPDLIVNWIQSWTGIGGHKSGKMNSIVSRWLRDWLIDKWHLSHNGVSVPCSRHTDNLHAYLLRRQGFDFVPQEQDSFKYMGVIFQLDLSFQNLIAEKINDTYAILTIIKWNFGGLEKDTLLCFIGSILSILTY